MPTHGRRGGEVVRARQVFGIFVSTFALATAFSLLSDSVLRSTTVYLAAFVLVVIVLTGIVFDIIGLATAAASHVPLNAMAAKRVPGARQALRLVRNAPRVATICNDLVGDICGTVSGAAGAAIVLHIGLSRVGPASSTATTGQAGGIWSVLTVALVAAVTVGGKALGKNLAISQADRIVFQVGRLLWWLEERFGLALFRERAGSRRASRRKVNTP